MNTADYKLAEVEVLVPRYKPSGGIFDIDEEICLKYMLCVHCQEKYQQHLRIYKRISEAPCPKCSRKALSRTNRGSVECEECDSFMYAYSEDENYLFASD